MDLSRSTVGKLQLNPSITLLVSLLCMALSWFLVNTVTVSAAISFWMKQNFIVRMARRNTLVSPNFVGSAAAAGLIISFYQRVDFSFFYCAFRSVLSSTSSIPFI